MLNPDADLAPPAPKPRGRSLRSRLAKGDLTALVLTIKTLRLGESTYFDARSFGPTHRAALYWARYLLDVVFKTRRVGTPEHPKSLVRVTRIR